MMNSDKNIEHKRYDLRASLQIGIADSQISLGSQTMPLYLRAPYIKYEQLIAENVDSGHECLEIGAGTGLHTKALLDTGANIVISDISEISLDVLSRKFSNKYKFHSFKN